MYSLILLIILCVFYYYLNLYFPRSIKENIYFGIFISLWIFLIYISNYQREFMYHIFKNIYEIQRKPRYDIDALTKYTESYRNNLHIQ